MKGAHFVRMVLNGFFSLFLTINTYVFIFLVFGFSLFFQSIGNGNGSIDPSMILPLSSICYEGMKRVPWH